MESLSEASRINMSRAAADALKHQAPDVALKPRGMLEVKGKGAMEARCPARGRVRGGSPPWVLGLCLPAAVYTPGMVVCAWC